MNIDNVKARLERSEGRVPHMYQCTGGKVTIGIGHALETASAASALPFRTPSTLLATAVAIENDWGMVAAAPADHTADYYKHYTYLTLPDPEIDALCDADIRTFSSGLEREFPDFESWPEPAQEAVFDMAFNLGIAGLTGKFPNCTEAIRAKDWAAAALRCHRIGISEARNQEIAALFAEASKA